MGRPKKQFDILARDLLDNLGNSNPTQKHIELMHSILGSVTLVQAIHFNEKLSQREISCLYLAAKGKTSEETAELLKISTATVDSHRKRIKRKLNCYSLTQAVFEGIRWGYIKPKHHKYDLTPSSKIGICEETSIE
jgi:DNA-binding CsgD family transcriptional regulator